MSDAATPAGSVARRVPSWAWIAVIVVGFVAQVFAVVNLRRPLGHDESVYLLRGRDIAELGWSTTSGGYWLDYRAPGLPLLAAGLGEVIGFHVSTSRMLVALLGAVVLVATWAIGRRFGGQLAGVLAAVMLASSSGFVLSSSLLLADIPGVAFAMVAIAWFAVDVDRGRLRTSAWGVPLLALAACISRFGAPFTLGPGLAAVAFIALPRLWRTRDKILAGQIVLVGAAVGLIGYLVLFTELVSLSGDSPAAANSLLIDQKGLTPASGFRDLLSVVNPWSSARFHMLSAPALVVLAVGVSAAIIGAFVQRSLRRPVIAFGSAAVISLVGVVASVGLVVVNYLTLTLPFWAIWAAIGWVWVIRVSVSLAGQRTTMIRAGAALGAMVVAWVGIGAAQSARTEATTGTRSFEALRSTSAQIRDAYFPDCLVITSYAPQVGYYSGCRVEVFAPLDRPMEGIIRRNFGRHPEIGDDWDGLVFVYEGGKRQPAAEEFDTSPALDRERLFEETSNNGRAHTWVQEVDLACVFDAAC